MRGFRQKTDRNHVEVMNVFRSFGFVILDLSKVGGGCPDFLAANKRREILVEVKDGEKPPSQRKLNEKQVAFHDGWPRDILIVTSIEEATKYAQTLRSA